MKKFRIPVIPKTSQVSIRLPNDVIEAVRAAMVGMDCTFSAFVLAAVRNALRDLTE